MIFLKNSKINKILLISNSNKNRNYKNRQNRSKKNNKKQTQNKTQLKKYNVLKNK